MLEHVAAYVDVERSDATDEDKGTDDTSGIDVWNQRYLGASTVSGLLLLGTAFGLLSGFTAGALAVVLFTGLTLAKVVLDNEGLGRVSGGA